jgi:hypothetical protein
MAAAQWRLGLRADFGEFGWQKAEDRGVLLGCHLEYGDRRFPVIVYERIRITQDVDAETLNGYTMYEPNVIVLKELTQETVETAVAELGADGSFDWLLG